VSQDQLDRLGDMIGPDLMARMTRLIERVKSDKHG
jgi:hypothetical protein